MPVATHLRLPTRTRRRHEGQNDVPNDGPHGDAASALAAAARPAPTAGRTLVMLGAALLLAACGAVPPRPAAPEGEALATGQFVTPLAVPGATQQFLNPGLRAYPDFAAGGAVRSVLSADGSTLAVLTAGQNSLFGPDGSVDAAHSTQYLFLYDVGGEHAGRPRLSQVIPQPNAHVGLAFAPDGRTLYAAGGADDAVYAYGLGEGGWSLVATIPLGHGDRGLGLGGVRPNAAGLALSADGRTLVVANNYNDSVSVVDTGTRTVRFEHDLRPFAAGNEGRAGAPGGTFPFGVVVEGSGTAWISCDRDRELVALDVSAPGAGRLLARIRLDGNPLGMALDAASHRLYVALDNADQVAVVDTAARRVVDRIDARAPAGMLGDVVYTGAGTFAVTLSPDGGTLYAVNAGANAIAVIPLGGPRARTVAALIPTAYEPHDVTLSADGRWLYVVNGKSATGPNRSHLSGATARLRPGTIAGGNAEAARRAHAGNQYQFQLERASLVAAPVPSAREWPALTARVAANDHYAVPADPAASATMAFLHDRIRHLIYVVRENRTFDQVLGDIGNGARADPSLAQFGEALTPNLHRLARQFVTLDGFMNPGDGSMDGWSWALQGRVTNTEALTQQIAYAAVNRGLSYESEGENRNVPVNLATVAERDAAVGPPGTTRYSDEAAALPGGAPNLLAGTGNHASTDAPFGAQKGYVFSAVLEAGLTVRNYGFQVRNIGDAGTDAAPLSSPHAAGAVQVAALEPQLAPLTDRYFRGFDQRVPDLWRWREWKREFDGFVERGDLPSLSLVRLSHDHMGAFGSALAGVNTPETQQADCDLATGLLVEAVARSRHAADTLVIVTEDDVQDGPDHVDSHRGPAFFVGPYVKRGVVVGTRYGQVNVLRTIEDILGTKHLNLNTAFQPPMADLFDIRGPAAWSYQAVASTVLKTTGLRIDADAVAPWSAGADVVPRQPAAYWERVTAGFDFSDADRVPAARFHRVLWEGMMGRRAYPEIRGAHRDEGDGDDGDGDE